MIETLKRFKLQIIILILIVISIPITFIQLSRQQETRSRATGGSPISLILDPLTSSQQLGTQFDVALTINTGTNNVTALDITILYNSSILTLVSFTPASTFSTITNDNSGTIRALHYVGVNPASSPITGSAVSIGSLKFQGVAAGTASVAFSNIQVTAQGQSDLLPIDTANTRNGSYIITTSTITPTPTPTHAPTPTPTGIPPGTTILNLTIAMTGIGNASSSASGINNNPKRPQRNVQAVLINSDNQQVATFNTTVNFDSATGQYKGNIGLGNNFISGAYLVKVRLDNTLWKTIPGILNIGSGQTYTAPEAALVSGDIIQNNEINLLDYNALLSCYGAKPCTTTTKVQADVNDDGKVDELDLNILYFGFSRRKGD